MSTFYMTENDTDPDLEATLKNPDGSAVDLTGASVAFSVMAPRGGGNVFTSSCTITDAANGVVKYNWGSTDTDSPGRYRAQFKATYASGDVEHFPNDGYHTLVINRNTEV